MSALQQWFDNKCPYQEGVLLYASLKCCNKMLLANFNKKKSPILYEKLKYELSKHLSKPIVVKPIVQYTAQKTTVKELVPNTASTSEKKEAIFFHQLPEELRPVLLEANNLFKEMCLLKVQLNELPAHAEKKALEIQLEITNRKKVNSLCWKRIDYFQKHKVMLQEKQSEIKNLSPAEMLRKEQYLFASISKLKKRCAENKLGLINTTSLKENNDLNRKIAKQEANILNQETELQNLKDLIHGKG